MKPAHRHNGRGGHADRRSFHGNRRSKLTKRERAEAHEKLDREQDAALKRVLAAMNRSYERRAA